MLAIKSVKIRVVLRAVLGAVPPAPVASLGGQHRLKRLSQFAPSPRIPDRRRDSVRVSPGLSTCALALLSLLFDGSLFGEACGIAGGSRISFQPCALDGVSDKLHASIPQQIPRAHVFVMTNPHIKIRIDP